MNEHDDKDGYNEVDPRVLTYLNQQDEVGLMFLTDFIISYLL